MREHDKSFLQKLQAQDAYAFGIIYDEYVDTFYRYIKAHYTLEEGDINDILSDIFVKIWHGMKRLDINSSLSGFLRTIARNHIKDYFKRRSDIPFATFNVNTQEAEQQREDLLQDPDDIIKNNEISFKYEAIQSAIATLDDIYKDPLLLRYVETLSYEEIAKTLGLSQDTVRQRISRGLKKLSEKLEHLA